MQHDPKQSRHTTLTPDAAPIVGRMRALWDSFRAPVIAAFPKAPGLPKNKKDYLNFVDQIYQSDAYHSLSIEGYRVTPEVIARVQGSGTDKRDQTLRSPDQVAGPFSTASP
jgi:hypothetical protein